jgi:hypothetical protein
MIPSFWINDEFGSGSHHAGQGEYSTFKQFLPFGHSYFGWLDEVGRETISNINMEVQMYPTNLITFTAVGGERLKDATCLRC